MRPTLRLVTGAAVLGVVSLTGIPAASAQSVDCNAYPQSCVDSRVLPDGNTAPATVVRNSPTPSTLPFTGGETVLIALAGAGAVAAGTVLVRGARRRGVTTA